ncbi:hypothetical protein HKD42_12920 [Altererythrobacter sp. RZ02]|uniref:Uncharacterized protein n=1 Tax=Pontixanthobacter rizhaonensis TaxID=2730337 RepID=A0A848QS89_9SPHN|nr:nucleotide synthetase [Pontixanthobacter rizhaonensis]NMW32965.1 hypothetical protein [Pontixanthobacter rizhaonensis]
MPRGGYEQHRINHDRPTRETPEHSATIKLDFEAEASPGRIIFTSGLTTGPEKPVTLLAKNNGKVASINVRKNCVINLVLDHIDCDGNEKWWRFSNQYDAITTKEELRDFYGKLKYLPDEAITHPDNDDIILGYRKVSFVIKHNRDGRMGSSHGFSINIDLLQSDPDSNPDDWEWLPITIDPEIKNPPGGGNDTLFDGGAPDKQVPFI